MQIAGGREEAEARAKLGRQEAALGAYGRVLEPFGPTPEQLGGLEQAAGVRPSAPVPAAPGAPAEIGTEYTTPRGTKGTVLSLGPNGQPSRIQLPDGTVLRLRQ